MEHRSRNEFKYTVIGFESKPPNAPDHPYYHLQEIPERQAEAIWHNQDRSAEVCESLFREYQRKKAIPLLLDREGWNHPSDLLLKYFGEEENPPYDPNKTRLENFPFGGVTEISQDEIIDYVTGKDSIKAPDIRNKTEELKNRDLIRASKNLIKAHQKEDTADVEFWLNSMELTSQFNLFDVWLAGRSILDHKTRTGKNYWDNNVNLSNDFEQFMGEIETAMDFYGNAPEAGQMFPKFIDTPNL